MTHYHPWHNKSNSIAWYLRLATGYAPTAATPRQSILSTVPAMHTVTLGQSSAICMSPAPMDRYAGCLSSDGMLCQCHTNKTTMNPSTPPSTEPANEPTLSITQHMDLLVKDLAANSDIECAVAEVERELALRPRVYKSQMEKGNMSRVDAETQYSRLKLALRFLSTLQEMRFALPSYEAAPQRNDIPF